MPYGGIEGMALLNDMEVILYDAAPGQGPAGWRVFGRIMFGLLTLEALAEPLQGLDRL